MREEQKNKGVSDTASLKRRSSLAIMCSLIGLVKPLLHIMLAAILLGTLGYLCAIFLQSWLVKWSFGELQTE